MKSLSRKQKDILEFIRRRITLTRIPPSIREIQQEFKFASPNAVTNHLKVLTKQGYIEVEQGKSRGIKLKGFTLPLGHEVPLLRSVPEKNSENRRIIRDHYVVDDNFFKIPPTFIYQMPNNNMQSLGIAKGDYLCVSSHDTIKNGDIVVATCNKKTMVGIFQKKRGQILIQSTNEPPQEMFIKISSSQYNLAKVVGCIRRI